MLSKPHILPLFPNSFNKFNEILALISDPLCNAPKLCFLHDVFFHGDLYNYGQSQVSVNEALKFKVNSLKIVADRFTQSFRYRAIIKPFLNVGILDPHGMASKREVSGLS